MAFFKTHERTLSSGIKVQLYRDVPSAPSTVLDLPILKESRKIEFSCATPLGIGQYSYRYRCYFVNKSNFINLFEVANINKLYLQVVDGSDLLFRGIMMLSTRKQPIYQPDKTFEITFVDPFYVNEHRDTNRFPLVPTGEMTVFGGLVATETSFVPGNFFVSHDWKTIDWTPTLAAPQQILQLIFNNNKYNDEGATYKQFIKDITLTLLASFGYSYTQEETVFIQFNKGYNADDQNVSINGHRDTGSNFAVASHVLKHFTTISKKGFIERRLPYGYIAAQVLDLLPNSTIVETTLGVGEILPSYEYSIPYNISATNISTINALMVRINSSTTYPAEEWYGIDDANTSAQYFLDEAINFTINKHFGVAYNQYELNSLDGFVDPLFPFVVDNLLGEDQILRATRGEWDLVTKRTNKLTAYQLGTFTAA